jgi:hypothetical protein
MLLAVETGYLNNQGIGQFSGCIGEILLALRCVIPVVFIRYKLYTVLCSLKQLYLELVHGVLYYY